MGVTKSMYAKPKRFFAVMGPSSRPFSHPRLKFLVAVAQNGVIGRQNTLPWHLPEDLKHFKERTMGQTCLMGRATYESIGRVLPGRRFVVLSNREGFQPDGVEVFGSARQALSALSHLEALFVIGGGSVYAELLPQAGELQLTRIYADIEGDTYFDFQESEWEVVRRSGRLTSVNGLDYEFIDYVRP